MKKLKTIFSPRNIIVWLFVLLLVVTVPKLNEPIMSDTDAIVTMMCVDSVDNNIELAVSVLSPADGKTAKYDIYTGTGISLGDAVDSVSLSIGKEVAFAQCEILAVGEGLAEAGVMKVLDYMTRTKKVGRNAFLLAFSGDIVDFATSVSKLNMDKSISLDKIISFDKRYILSKESNIEQFYIGYYSPISLGIMPIVRLESNENLDAVEVSATGGEGASSSSGSSGQSSGEEKKYIVNDGSMMMFKEGKKYLELSPEIIEKANFFINNAQRGAILLKNVKDDLYDDVDVVIQILNKKTKFTPKFEGEKPIMEVGVEITVFVEQVQEELPTRDMLQRNQNFLTDAVIDKIKSTIEDDMNTCIAYCRENSVDLLSVYKNFYAKKNRQFESYLESVGLEKYLDGVDFKISIKVNSEY